MTLQEINKAYNRIVGSLDSKELKNAFDSLQALIAGSREYSFQDKLNELQDTYKYMLRYRSKRSDAGTDIQQSTGIDL